MTVQSTHRAVLTDTLCSLTTNYTLRLRLSEAKNYSNYIALSFRQKQFV